VSDQRWLDGSLDPVESELRRALDDAQARTGDDVALRRLWSKLSQATSPVLRPRSLSRWRWFVGGVASSALLAAVLAVVFWPGRVPTASAVAPVAVTRPARPVVVAAALPAVALPAAPARRVFVGPATVRTSAGETLALALPGGVAASVGPRSTLSLDGEQRPSVNEGDVAFSVPHQAPGKNFVVVVGVYRVVVVGTKFRVHSGERISVDVDEGVVEVWRDTVRLARLAVGESWAGLPAPVADAPAAPAVTRTRTPAAVRVRSRIHRRALAVAQASSSTASSAATESVAAAGGRAAPLALPETDAEEALAAGDVRRGLELYGEILARGGPAAENAAYEIGKILRDRLRQPEAAVAAWRRYRDANANGILRVEADVSIVETLVRLGDSPGALSEASRFLRDHPDSERRDEIARIAGDLQRAGGDCRSAIRSYELTQRTSRRAELIDRASFGRAACLKTLGDAGAADALRRYLSDFPAGLFLGDATRLSDETEKATP
jgi:hypothetical protein